MKFLRLLVMAGQFGFSAVFPLCFFLLLAAWLQNQHSWGSWTASAGGILGLLISIRTVCANWQAMKKAADEISPAAPEHFFSNDQK